MSYTILCSSRKYPYSPHRRDCNFLGVGGSVRPKNLKKCMKLNWNFQRSGRGGGSKKKSLLWGRYGYFLELHIKTNMANIRRHFQTFSDKFGLKSMHFCVAQSCKAYYSYLSLCFVHTSGRLILC